MFIPIGDENPRERTPYVNYFILGANIAAFLLFTFPRFDPERNPELIHYVMRPAALEWHTLFTSLFLHANLMHLIGNLLFLWIFGDNVEDRLGHVGYAIFYLACGLAADGAHLLAFPNSLLPTLGASGAISGVMGAYLVFFPRHRVKMLLWFWIYVDVILTPAYLWIGIWFLQQVFFSTQNTGGVAYLAHIGGFAGGAAVGALVRLAFAARIPSARIPAEIRAASQSANTRRPFITIDDDSAIEFMDEPEDSYAVLRLSDDLPALGPIAEIATKITGEDSREVARRLEATRGMISKGIPRVAAERVQRELHVNGIPAAIILHNRANRPPVPAPIEAVSWDARTLRLRLRDQSLTVPWSSPFLYIGARVGKQPFLDLFVNRRTAYRVVDAPEIPLTEVDPLSRTEQRTTLAGFARSVVKYRASAALNEGVRVLAHRGAWGWLSFRSSSDYDDYLFWIYNLILSQVPIHRG
jgi:membrane associated rhomboid family serine protease